MTKPLVSIIIPVFNGEKTIGPLLVDVLEQSEPRIEIIIVDDGSSDQTLKVVEDLAALDGRVILVSQPNSGPSIARNKALDKAQGEYIMFFDADDRIDNTIVEKMFKKISTDKSIDMVEAGCVIEHVDEIGRITSKTILMPACATKDHKKHVLKSLIKNGLFHSLWNKIYKTSVIKENKIYFKEDIRNGEDLIFNLAYTSHSARYEVLPESLYHYRRVENSRSITGTQRGASRVFEYRKAMFASLQDYIGNAHPLLIATVRLRWFISSILAVLRTKMAL